MITLSVVIYVVFSLSMARHKYCNPQYDYFMENINKCYRNGKMSLIYGFIFIPSAIMFVGLIFVVIYYGFGGLLWIGAWVFRNMP